jgi:type II secretory pathway pseudopilin PulG
MKKLKNRGQSLIEVLTALAIAVLVIIALVAGVTFAIRNLTHAKNQALATQYAQEGLEMARKARDVNPTAFFVADLCDSWDIQPVDGIFHRTWDCSYNSGDVDDPSDDSMDITVVVSWDEGAKTQTTTLVTKLTNWR